MLQDTGCPLFFYLCNKLIGVEDKNSPLIDLKDGRISSKETVSLTNDMNYPLRTERLFIRGIMEQDAADILEIRGDQDTADWAGVPCMESIDDAMESIYSYDSFDDIPRAFSILLGDEVIGLIEIYSDDELLYNEDFLGYYVKRNHRGKGYMTEALTALRSKWHEEGTNIPMLWIFPGNDASIRVAIKSGWNQASHLTSPII